MNTSLVSRFIPLTYNFPLFLSSVWQKNNNQWSLLSVVSKCSENGSASDIKDLDQTSGISCNNQTPIVSDGSRVGNILES